MIFKKTLKAWESDSQALEPKQNHLETKFPGDFVF